MKTTSVLIALASIAAAQQAVSQIGDGQIQAGPDSGASATRYAMTNQPGSTDVAGSGSSPDASATDSPGYGSSSDASATGAVVSQIGDGQPQSPAQTGSGSDMGSGMGAASGTGSAASPSMSITPYTGAAAQVAVGGVAVLGGVVAVLAL
ncbi:hypothetical protein AC578_2965 [Pseudocercospora eumusae]|uniref:Uncharacterized protein n=1 Tax=Pseudocercospora eumusae TaxID=321146 RepID=A0A139HEB3_9PEZI|nr:hypothetical protein AC578_2965 [Pseudocercospora eumusae]